MGETIELRNGQREINSAPTIIGEDRYITVRDVADMLGCSTVSVYSYSAPNSPNRLHGFPLPRQLGKKNTRFLLSEILSFMRAQPSTEDRHHKFKSGQSAA